MIKQNRCRNLRCRFLLFLREGTTKKVGDARLSVADYWLFLEIDKNKVLNLII